MQKKQRPAKKTASRKTSNPNGSTPLADSKMQGKLRTLSPTRGERRKQETRERLLSAAFQLMAQRSMDSVAIEEITAGADVGVGSFYNHFSSKEAIYLAVMDKFFEEFGDALDQLVTNIDDPAEIVGISVRQTLLRVRHEPLWGQFLLREGFSERIFARGLGVRLFRDIERGLQAGRFKSSDPLMTFVAAGGAVLGAIALTLNQKTLDTAMRKQLSLVAGEIPERTVAVLLQALGLTPAEAKKISRRPLPKITSA